MLYDIRLACSTDYDAPVMGGRHHIRVAPATLAGAQRVIAASLTFDPKPQRQSSFIDFFGQCRHHHHIPCNPTTDSRCASVPGYRWMM